MAGSYNKHGLSLIDTAKCFMRGICTNLFVQTVVVLTI